MPTGKDQSLALVAKTAFPVLAYDPLELQELLLDNLGGMAPKLQRISWPTGGNLAFKLQTDEGPKMVPNLTGLVVHHVPNRLFWEQSFDESGGGQRPDCSSADGMIGHGKPFDAKTGLIHPKFRNDKSADTFSCRQCPLSQFHDEERPRCRELHPLFMILKSDSPDEINLLPVIVSIPPSSLEVWSAFSGMLLNRGFSYRRAIVEVGLEEATGGPSGKIAYSKAVIKRVGLLTNEEYAFMRDYGASLAPLFERYKDAAVDSVDEDDEEEEQASAYEDETDDRVDDRQPEYA